MCVFYHGSQHKHKPHTISPRCPTTVLREYKIDQNRIPSDQTNSFKYSRHFVFFFTIFTERWLALRSQQRAASSQPAAVFWLAVSDVSTHARDFEQPSARNISTLHCTISPFFVSGMHGSLRRAATLTLLQSSQLHDRRRSGLGKLNLLCL